MLVGLHHNFVILRSWILKVFNKNTISALLGLLRLLSGLSAVSTATLPAPGWTLIPPHPPAQLRPFTLGFVFFFLPFFTGCQDVSSAASRPEISKFGAAGASHWNRNHVGPTLAPRRGRSRGCVCGCAAADLTDAAPAFLLQSCSSLLKVRCYF